MKEKLCIEYMVSIIWIFIVILVIAILIKFYQTYSRSCHACNAEGFAPLANVKNPLTITSVLSARAQLPLMQYCIKGSYNSAYDGTNITLPALDQVLARGARFIDLEVYSTGGESAPVVAYSVDPTFSSLSSGNSLLLTTVLNEIVGNAFTSSVPNPRDPLFLQLRINTTCGLSNATACSIYQQVAGVLETTIKPRMYTDSSGNAMAIDGTTPLADFMGKVIVVIDASINPDYKNYVQCDATAKSCYNLKHYVNVETGGTVWRKTKYSDYLNQAPNPLIIESSDSMQAEPTTGALKLNLVVPDIGSHVQNPSTPDDFIAKYGCQTILYKFYMAGSALSAYESLFNEYSTAFVPLGFAVNSIANADSK